MQCSVGQAHLRPFGGFFMGREPGRCLFVEGNTVTGHFVEPKRPIPVYRRAGEDLRHMRTVPIILLNPKIGGGKIQRFAQPWQWGCIQQAMPSGTYPMGFRNGRNLAPGSGRQCANMTTDKIDQIIFDQWQPFMG